MWWGIIRTPRVTNVFVDMASGSSFESESLSATSHEVDALSTLDESHEDEEGSSSFSEVAPDPVLSLLSKLKSPRPSDLARKRRVAANPPKGKRPCRGSTAAEPKSIMAYQRVKQFAGEPFSVSRGKLFCNGCREELSLKMSVVRNHIRSAKHEEGHKRLKSKELREKSIADALAAHNKETHLKGETLPTSQQVYRVKVLTCFLRAGVPLRKYDHFRELLEENAMRLSDLIPFVLREEQQKIKQEISSEYVSVIFDGTSRLGEALAVVLRFISVDWTIDQRLIRVQLLAKSLSGEEIAREIISILSTSYGIESNRLLACMRDGAASNGVAVRTLTILYPNLLDIKCFSHTLDRVGEHYVPVLNEFISLWISMFSHSPKARLFWREQTGSTMRSYSPTRWWSKWEVIQQLIIQFGDVVPFLAKYPDVAPATNAKLQAFLQDRLKSVHLQLEPASIVDWGEHFVKATYTLEGDGPLCLRCYEVIDAIYVAIASAHVPNVEAVAKKLATEIRGIHESQMLQYAQKAIQPGLDYFKSQMEGTLKDALSAFKAARLFCPQKAHTMQPRAADLDSLKSFPFLNDDDIKGLKDELPVYLSKCSDTDANFCPLEWWRRNCGDLPIWSACARKVLLVQPSSAASERVFSMLKASFHDQQDNSLQDYIKSSLMLQYNDH